MPSKKTPEITTSKSDPGDDIIRRFRYQCTYAAILSIAILLKDSVIKEIYCEHHEDVLMKTTDNRLIGIQVKTRDVDLGAYKAEDKQIENSIKRFVELEMEFNDSFTNFVIATNVGFVKDKTSKGLHYILELCANADPQKKREVKKWLNKIADKSRSDIDTVIKVLKKTRLKSDIGNIDDIEAKLNLKLDELPELDQSTLGELKQISSELIKLHIDASSLKHKSPLNEYFIYQKEPTKSEEQEIIKGKKITKVGLMKIIGKYQTDKINIYLKDDPDNLVNLTDTSKMEIKLDAGGVSNDNIQLLKDNKFSMEQKTASWIHKWGAKKSGKRYNQIKSIVHNECQHAYDDHVSTKESSNDRNSNGTKMLVALRTALKERYKLDNNLFLGCSPEHLYGMAGILTADCKVWWSEKFDLNS